MIQRRRARLALLALAASAATAGCTTFSDNDVVARVGDEELTGDEVAELLAEASSPADAADDDRVDAEAARAAVSSWIRGRIISASDIGQRYVADPGELGVTCLDVAAAVDEADAQSIAARLDAGETWDEVVGPLEAAIGYESVQTCQPLSFYAAQFGDEVADRLGALKPGEPPQLVDAGAGGFAVIRIQELDVVDTGTLLAAVQGIEPDAIQVLIDSIAATDVYVDPRVGQFDADSVAVLPVS